MRRLPRSLVLFCVLGAGAAVAASAALGANPVGAAAPDQQGWWTTLNQGRAPEVGQPTPSPTPPDVPAQGLLVEGPAGAPSGAGSAPVTAPSGSAGAPLAYAGLVYSLPLGATASTLTLSVAANSATTPKATLQLCPLVNPVLQPEQGGPSSDAPPYDCTHNVSAAPNAAGNGYQFQVSQLVTDGSLAVAILPTSPTDRVVFSQPDANSLAVGPSLGGTQTQTQGSSLGGTPIPAAGTPTPEAFPIPILGTTSFGATPSPTVTGGPAPSGAASPAPSTPAEAAPRPDSAIPVLGAFGGGNANPLTVALVVTGLSGGAALWFITGRRRADEPQVATDD